jgi:hypothetical protein
MPTATLISQLFFVHRERVLARLHVRGVRRIERSGPLHAALALPQYSPLIRVQTLASDRQKLANRANARRSTGPKSPTGKRAVRLNGLRHGLLSRDVVLPGEDAEGFEKHRNAVRSELAPSGPLEGFLADRVVNAIWRLRRLERAEVALFHWHLSTLAVERRSATLGSFVETICDPLPMLGGYETVIKDKIAHADAKEALDRARCERDREEVFLGRSFNADAKESDTFGKLARYETALERSLYKALHEFQRLQAARHGQPVPVPEAMDVDVSVSAQE